MAEERHELAARARERLHELIELGNSLQEIANHLNVAQATLQRISDGTTQRPNTAILQRILELPLEAFGRHELAEPLARRLRALAALGHSQQKIATAGGLSRDLVQEVQTKGWRRILSTDAARIRKAYAILSDQPAGKRSALRAEQLGWPPPAAWTETDLDDTDPNTTARVQRQWQQQPKQRSYGETLRDARLREDYTREELAAKLNISLDTVRAWETERSRPTRRRLEPLYALLKWRPPE